MNPDEALGGGNQGPSAPGWARQHHSQRDPPFVPLGGTRRVGGLVGVAGRLSGTVSPFSLINAGHYQCVLCLVSQSCPALATP